MNPQKPNNAGLDELLRSALADDLPPDVAAGMRGRIAAFRAGLGEAPAAPGFLFRRELWATLAVLMLIAGCLLQGFRTRNPLAERIASIKAGISNTEGHPLGVPEKKEARP